MADSPPPRNSRSPSPWKAQSRSRSRSRSVPREKSRSVPRERSRSRSVPRQRPRSSSRSRGRSRSRSQERFDPSNPGTTLYVTGLSARVTQRDLEEHFSKEGKVASCFLVVEPRTRISRGFAFVTMETFEDADRCIKYLNQSVLEGRYITVERSRRKRPRTPTPGHYLGLKNTRDYDHRGDHRSDRGRYRGGSGREDYRGGSGREDYRGGFGREEYRGGSAREDYRGGSGREDYSYRRSPRRSPYRGGPDYPSRHSPYGGRSRRDRSRSMPYSPHARGSR